MKTVYLLELSFALLLARVTTARSDGSTSNSGNSYSIIQRPCLNTSMSTWTLTGHVASLRQCLVLSRFEKRSEIGVVQLNRQDRTCSLFIFSRVCPLLNLASPAMSGAIDPNMCEIVVDSELDSVTANQHFAAVWIGGKGPQLENLVCDSRGQRNSMEQSGVSWTDEGASMDGLTSRMWVADSSGFNFNPAFTWLIELRRTPGHHALIEVTDCSYFTQAWLHLWEFDDITPPDTCRLFLNNGQANLLSKYKILPATSDQFARIGAAFHSSMGSNSSKLFHGRDYLSNSDVAPMGFGFSNISDRCLKIGWRDLHGSSTKLKGIVKMVAVSNNYLSADVINQLFNAK